MFEKITVKARQDDDGVFIVKFTRELVESLLGRTFTITKISGNLLDPLCCELDIEVNETIETTSTTPPPEYSELITEFNDNTIPTEG